MLEQCHSAPAEQIWYSSATPVSGRRDGSLRDFQASCDIRRATPGQLLRSASLPPPGAGFVPQQAPAVASRMGPLRLRLHALMISRMERRLRRRRRLIRCPLLRRRPLHTAAQYAFHPASSRPKPGGKPTAFKCGKIAILQLDLPPVETVNGRVERKQLKLFTRTRSTDVPPIFR